MLKRPGARPSNISCKRRKVFVEGRRRKTYNWKPKFNSILWHCSSIESYLHTGICVFDPKSTYDSINQSDDKDEAKDDVVQDVGAALALWVVDVHPTDDQEQEAHY